MHSKNDFNIENYIKALSTYIPASSMVKLKKSYKAFTFTKHPKSTILENRQLNDSFCILICGTIRHYTIDSNTAEEQTLRFTLSGNLLCQYGTATEATEYLSCLSECTILSVSNTINFSRDRRRNKFENILSKYYKRKLRVRSGSIKNATRKAIYKTMQTISKHISDGPIKIHCVIFRNHSPSFMQN